MTEPSPPYQQQPAVPYTGPLVPPTNTLAIIALVLGLIVPPGGIICGHLAMSQIKRTGEGGHGLALAGLIIGYVYTGLIVLVFIAYALIFVAVFGVIATAGTTGALTP